MINKIKEKIKNNHIINKLAPHFNNIEAYIVGGFLRDCILDIKSNDIDIVLVNESSKEHAQKLANKINGYFVPLDEINNIYRVVLEDKQTYIDIADCVGNSIEDDIKRRDFTFNAMAYDLNNNIFIDIVNGVKDMEQGIIREITKQNMFDDPIRLFRAFRFKSQFGYSFSETLQEVLPNSSKLLQYVAKERINTELMKLFEGMFIIEGINSLNKYNILDFLFPILSEIKKIPPNAHHHLPLFEHSVETVKQVDVFYNKSDNIVKQHLDTIFLGGYKRLAWLKLGAFLHDVGKPATWQIDKTTGRHRFIGHDSVGAEIITQNLKDLKFSKKQISYIQKIIKNHIYPASIVTSDETTEKAFLRFYRKIENETIDLIAIAYADRMSALGPDITENILKQNIDGLEKLLQGYFLEKDKLAPLPKLLDGKEIMELLKIEASPLLGTIIKKLKEAQLSSDVVTKEDAINYLKNLSLK